MAAISSERPVRIPIVAVTTDRVLVQGLAEEFGAQFAALGTWPDPGVRAAEVLLIDLEVLPRSRWPQLVRRSRHTDRPEIVLIDDQEMPRAILARFAADELIAHDTGLAGIVTIAREHTIAYAFRETAEQIRADPRFPYPLNAFLGAACSDQIGRVGALADAYGFRHSTLRNQWRACRPDSSVRLEDVVRQLARLRALADRMPQHELRSLLKDLWQAWLVGDQRAKQ